MSRFRRVFRRPMRADDYLIIANAAATHAMEATVALSGDELIALPKTLAKAAGFEVTEAEQLS